MTGWVLALFIVACLPALALVAAISALLLARAIDFVLGFARTLREQHGGR